MADITAFDKYETLGAYHWSECDRRYANWRRYNPAVDARYQITIEAIQGLNLRGTLLDIGCGDGLLMARVAHLMQRVKGVDSEKTAIGLAREKLLEFPNCEVIHASSYELPFRDASFDVVVSADVIEHLKDPAHHLREACRVMRTHGAFVLTTPKWRRDRKWDARHEREYHEDELRTLLSEYFQKIEIRFFWPLKWSRFYATKIGWRLLKFASIELPNPFLKVGQEPKQFGQILAVCSKPRT